MVLLFLFDTLKQKSKAYTAFESLLKPLEKKAKGKKFHQKGTRSKKTYARKYSRVQKSREN